jgi:intracellular multiplication protein IcmT
MSAEKIYWRDASRPVKFFMLDAQAIYPFVVWMFFPSVWLLEVAGVVAIFFSILSKYGISLVVFLRITRTLVAGPRKSAIPWWSN